jgi:hypothetical protein
MQCNESEMILEHFVTGDLATPEHLFENQQDQSLCSNLPA